MRPTNTTTLSTNNNNAFLTGSPTKKTTTFNHFYATYLLPTRTEEEILQEVTNNYNSPICHPQRTHFALYFI